MSVDVSVTNIVPGDGSNIWPSAILATDVNGDGIIDLLITQNALPPPVAGQNYPEPIRIFLGGPSGGFVDGTSKIFPNNVPKTVFNPAIYSADFQGTGRSDYFIPDNGADSPPFPGYHNSLLLAQGASGLIDTTSALPSDYDYTLSGSVGDINGDGRPDIWVGVLNHPGYFLINQGGGVFSKSTDLVPTAYLASSGTGFRHSASLIVDLNGDAANDLILGGFTNNSVILYNDKSGHFGNAYVLPDGVIPTPQLEVMAIKTIALSGTGTPDLLLGEHDRVTGLGALQLLSRNADGSYTDETSSRVVGSTNPGGLAGLWLADLFGTGQQDIITRGDGGATQGGLSILVNVNGRFYKLPETYFGSSIAGYDGYYTFSQPFLNKLTGHIDIVGFGPSKGYSTFEISAPAAQQTLAGAGGLVANPQGSALTGGTGDSVLIGLGGNDTLVGGAGNDLLVGGGGVNSLDGGGGFNTAAYSGRLSDYQLTASGSGWKVVDLRPTAPDGTDILQHIQALNFRDQTVSLNGLDPSVSNAISSILRESFLSGTGNTLDLQLSANLISGSSSLSMAIHSVITTSGSTASVATLAYEFFTGSTPSAGGMDYLVSPTGPNPNNLNAPYYQHFSLENRYINFAVNLGKVGAGAAAFQTGYGSLSLSDAMTKAYTTIFGTTPTAAKVDTLLNGMVPDGLGGTETRALYFAFYGQDGLTGIGTKAAMVGWLLGEAVKADVGDYALSNDAFLADIAAGTGKYGVDLIGQYDKASYHYTGG